jgi:hypothetical protein
MKGYRLIEIMAVLFMMILWVADPLLENNCKISDYTTTIAR